MGPLSVEYRLLTQIFPYARNSRTHSDEQVMQIAASIREFGFTNPVLIDEEGEIIAGHGRVLAANKLKMDAVPCIPLKNLTDTQKRAYVIADNRIALNAGWDPKMLEIELRELENNHFDLELLGFQNDELAALLYPESDSAPDDSDKKDPPPDASEVDDLPDPEKLPKRVNLGDVFKLGNHLLVCGDSLDSSLVTSVIGENEAHSIVTDPPYGLSFMGKKWDYDVPSKELWEIWGSRIKPGAHVLSFSATRTFHRMVLNIEDAGFEIRDMLQWLYGQGFPKSQDISKAIDKAAGAERDVIFEGASGKGEDSKNAYGDGLNVNFAPRPITAPSTPEAKQWSGWGSALKPANEPICLARKPIIEDTIANNVIKHGTGGLNIDGTRIAGEPWKAHTATGLASTKFFTDGEATVIDKEPHTAGRFPSNVILDGDAAAVLDEQSGLSPSNKRKSKGTEKNGSEGLFGVTGSNISHDDSGGASRFFYVAKPSKSQRDDGNTHATVKPIKLMEYLVTLITPKGGIVLEPFCGSGTTLLACETQGMACRAFELDPGHCDIILFRWEKLTGKKAELI